MLFGASNDAQQLEGMQRSLSALEKQKAKVAEVQGRISYFNLLNTLLPLRFLALAGALALLWASWTANPMVRLISIGTGAAAATTGVLIYLLRSALSDLVGVQAGSMLGSVAEASMQAEFEAAVSLGWGVYLIAAAGVALIAAGLGMIRNPLAARS